ncbi:MAG: glutamate synthase large subunit [Bacteroidetes bacterium]|nr:glutamate synthase large subunit [Bacteroidota bacterium]MDE2671062.1 glutamate synthase large subunit [Bacteroidota bacterium]
MTKQQGLYDPAFEHDACGVGLYCRIDGTPSHGIVKNGLEILMELDHRGACGCDETTGDGAGILIQLPHAFFEYEVSSLPELDDYGVGMVFIPPRHEKICKQLVENILKAEGVGFIAWRRVPTDSTSIGPGAKITEPAIWQCFVQRSSDVALDAFERQLYLVRKVFQQCVLERRLHGCYFASLSAKTIVYKGMLMPEQLPAYYPDLSSRRFKSALAMVHSRFSTNTFPEWSLAQPFRFLCHNGEINTLRGNINQMHAAEVMFRSERFGEDTRKLVPIIREGGSDSMALDNVLELLYYTGRSLPHSMMMLIPEAWEHNEIMPDEKRAFYQYHSNLMEPWDGPATIPFTDGRYAGALLDRNGLRPSRYNISKDGYVVLASETGVGGIPESNVLRKGRLKPGRMFLVDLEEKRVIEDEEIKARICSRAPYRVWLNDHQRTLASLPPAEPKPTEGSLLLRQQMFGYTLEDMRLLMAPMGKKGKEPLGAMGNDTPLAVLSDRPRLLYDYFKQLFAQVTNPPLDAIRESMVTSLALNLGSSGNLFTEGPWHCEKLRLHQPILTEADLASIETGIAGVATLNMCFQPGELSMALERLQEEARHSISHGCSLIVLSDRDAGKDQLPIPALLATGAVHHYLIEKGLRLRCGLIVDSGEPREVHHFAMLIGYGAEAICPYVALSTVRRMALQGQLGEISAPDAEEYYIKAIGQGLLKVMSKMGISTLQSYRGAQIFEAIGLSSQVIEEYFCRTPSRIGGIGLREITKEVVMRHECAYPEKQVSGVYPLDVGGQYQWRRGGERHAFSPTAIANMQEAARTKSHKSYKAFADEIDRGAVNTLRGLLSFNYTKANSVDIDEVVPWTEIVKSFKTGAMSNGSISGETHEALAIAMNSIGGKSNTGEGGEGPERYGKNNSRRSRIKQVASGRFGVTIEYLESADEIQIKMAQGAKPGEGGQLPGKKVYPWIAKLRHSTPYVGLISPPPHHDIYSIEDLAQLIHDLKNANPRARISVKLVSEVGVGTVAAGVAKGKADIVLISGTDGGTGASPQTSIMHAGLPWELGLSETHQTLVSHGLRSRIIVECDGQMKTGRDVAVAALLGADEFGFATAPLVALGCIMMRKCHLNTCPVGIATQDPELRKKFRGQPEHVVNYLHFVAEDLRKIMARLGVRTLAEMRGRVDLLKPRRNIKHWKAHHLDLSRILVRPEVPEEFKAFAATQQDHGLEGALDHTLIALAKPTLQKREPVVADIQIRNINRTVGTMLSNAITQRFRTAPLPDDTVTFNCIGSAGQSFAAFACKGITFNIQGDANDYFGKGLSGAKLTIMPPPEATYVPHKNVTVGNVALYGATSGEAYIRGGAGERFCVRNSGVRAVVEAVGDHGCEYMTGGRVVVLGETGRNFAAGMSGGIAYVIDATQEFRRGRCNMESVELLPVEDEKDIAELRAMIENHFEYTGSRAAQWILKNWDRALTEFIQVMPIEYRNALRRLASESDQLAVAA